ncbi:MAG: hypothetical protein RL565_722 [Pseudomonadota bacterium]|jgi:hypothetical protein
MLNNPRSLSALLSISMMLVIGAFGSAHSSSAFAQTPPVAHGKTTGTPEKKPDGTWEGLKPEQQKILAPLESDWDYMLPDSRKKWIQVANLYPKMSEADQQRLQSRMTSWSNLSQKDRRIARENYLSSLKFPAEKKAEAWSAYQKLSDEQKKKLAQAEVNKKKPTAASAPTLQQHPITQKSNLAPTLPVSSTPAPEATAPSTSTDSSSSNP